MRVSELPLLETREYKAKRPHNSLFCFTLTSSYVYVCVLHLRNKHKYTQYFRRKDSLFLERESARTRQEWVGEEEGERENPKLPVQHKPNPGLNLTTLRS